MNVMTFEAGGFIQECLDGLGAFASVSFAETGGAVGAFLLAAATFAFLRLARIAWSTFAMAIVAGAVGGVMGNLRDGFSLPFAAGLWDASASDSLRLAAAAVADFSIVVCWFLAAAVLIHAAVLMFKRLRARLTRDDGGNTGE